MYRFLASKEWVFQLHFYSNLSVSSKTALYCLQHHRLMIEVNLKLLYMFCLGTLTALCTFSLANPIKDETQVYMYRHSVQDMLSVATDKPLIFSLQPQPRKNFCSFCCPPSAENNVVSFLQGDCPNSLYWILVNSTRGSFCSQKYRSCSQMGRRQVIFPEKFSDT